MENKGLLKLPETWHVKITKDNREVVRKWRGNNPTLTIGDVVGMNRWEYGRVTKEHNSYVDSDFGQEITFADFKRLVLDEKNHEDYGVLGCEELSVYFENNNIEDLEGRIKENIYYILSEWDYEDFENSKRQILPLKEYLKLIDEKPESMESKYEYKLKDEKFNSAISILINNDYTGKNLYTDKDRIAISNLEATNTLDLFFDKVEVRFTLMTTTLKGKLTIQLHPTSQVENLKSNGWKITTEEHINQIREYLNQ